ncbi:MAG: hypothetical protein AB7P03_03180 [Kofleriaceae bacterium]
MWPFGRDPVKILRRLVEEKRAIWLDGECIDSFPLDYEVVIREMQELTGGALAIDEVGFEELADTVTCSSRGQSYVFDPGDPSDYVDHRLFGFLNGILAANGCERRLWNVWSDDLFGQDFMIVFATRAERDELARKGVPIGAREDGLAPGEDG